VVARGEKGMGDGDALAADVDVKSWKQMATG
jgi:hypothetical protein